MRILAVKAFALAGSGAVVGMGLGVASVMIILGSPSLFAAANADLVASASVAAGAGVLITAAALYAPGRRALLRNVNDERKELAVPLRPVWHRCRLDFGLLALAAAAYAVQRGGSGARTASVSAGQPISLPTRLLVAPFAVWIGGTLIFVRIIAAMASRLGAAQSPRYGPLLWGTLRRSIRRRSWSVATGAVGVALVVAFGTNLLIFSATYEAAKSDDSRFVVGSDLRITPSVQSAMPHDPGYGAALKVSGVAAVTPVVFSLENSVLIGPFTQDRTDLAAIDPVSFHRVAALSDSSFERSSAAAVMAALTNDPRGLLVRTSRAEDLSIETGDRVQVLLARGTKQQTLQSFRVVGLFETFPGFPQGTDLVANVALYRSVTGLDQTDFFLARASARGRRGLARAVAALQSGPGRDDQLRIDTTATTLNKDQSSLTAVNVRGLLDLGSLYAMALAGAAISMVVFGLLLQRRKEYLTLRALGLSTPHLFVLVLGEAHLRRVLREYVCYFNRDRPHQGLAQRVPVAPEEGGAHTVTDSRVHAIPVLGGLHHAYARAA